MGRSEAGRVSRPGRTTTQAGGSLIRRPVSGTGTGTADVPFVALARQHRQLRPQLDRAFASTVDASGFVLSEQVESFEHEFAAYCGVEHCVGVASGTAALTLSMIAAGVKPGDEIVLPAHTYIASALGVVHAGAQPVFCDVRDDTGLIDPQAAEAAVSERTVGILAVHLYGQICDMEALQATCDRHGLALFEDAAQAHGATRAGRRAGSLGRAAAFSFYPSKNLGALGDGGAICTNDALLAERARQLRNLGQRRKGEHLVAGYNERLDGLQAAMLRVKLPHLDDWNARRRGHAAAYVRGLPPALTLPHDDPAGSPVFHVFGVRVRDRDAMASRLSAQGIETSTHYRRACPDHPALEGFGQHESGFPRARAWADEQLSLPMFPELAPTEIERVIEACHLAAAPPIPMGASC